MEDVIPFYRDKTYYDKEHAEKVRKKHLLNKLPNNKKLELYNCSVNGDVKTLIKYVEEDNYSIFEEISAAGYFWTALHYAAHYGNIEIVEYVLEKINDNSDKLDMANLQSNLGLSPLFIALSNSLDIEKKKRILDVFIKYDSIDFKISNVDNLDIFDVCKKHNLLEYFLSILRED